MPRWLSRPRWHCYLWRFAQEDSELLVQLERMMGDGSVLGRRRKTKFAATCVMAPAPC